MDRTVKFVNIYAVIMLFFGSKLTAFAFQRSHALRVVKPSLLGNWSSRRRSLKMMSAATGTKAEGKFKLVIVESPAKAKTIQKILNASAKDGAVYEVDFCAGHVRDLPSNAKEVPAEVKARRWPVLGVDVEGGFAPLYVTKADKRPVLKRLRDKVRGASEVVLATDEDREGEAISWHLLDALGLQEEEGGRGPPVRRAVFHEITPRALRAAFDAPRALDRGMVDAQEARRLLDRLAGYTVSPLLWRKVAPGLSAGRVQSAALAMIVRRERQRLEHVPAEYWGARAALTPSLGGGDGPAFSARMVSVDGKVLAVGKDFDNAGVLADRSLRVLDAGAAAALAARLAAPGTAWRVVAADHRASRRQPPAPLITSTLQQEAARRLGLSPSACMQVAQRLYEAGHITYMRTDNPTLSDEAIELAKSTVRSTFGEEYLGIGNWKMRKGGKAPANAQEAHEAIRPCAPEGQRAFRSPAASGLQGLELGLYTLVYKRTLAVAMADAQMEFTAVEVEATPQGESAPAATFKASGKRVVFPGFLKAYEDVTGEEGDILLPKLVAGQDLGFESVEPTEHSTQPPSRFSEAGFVAALEGSGVGRPSTYARTAETLRERGYVQVEGRQLRPSLTAMVVVDLLERHFPDYVDTGFTAGMEAALDRIARGELPKLGYLEQYYLGPDGLRAAVDRAMEAIDPSEGRRARLPGLGEDALGTGVKVLISKWGPYVEKVDPKGQRCTAQIPTYLQYELEKLDAEAVAECLRQSESNGVLLGTDPATGQEIRAKIGRFGPYLELMAAENPDGESSQEKMKKNKCFGLAPGTKIEDIDFDQAVQWLSLPRHICNHPTSGKPVSSNIGRFGPYIQHGNIFATLKKDCGYDVFNVIPEVAVELVDAKAIADKPLAELGDHDGQEILVKKGRWGPYLKFGREKVPLPQKFKDNVDGFSLDEALKLLDGKGLLGKKKKAGSKSPAKKNAFQMFMAEKRPGLKAEGLALGQIQKKGAALWKDMGEQEKQAYQKIADNANAELGLDSTTAARGSSSSKASSTKSPAKKNAFQMFMAEKRPDLKAEGLALGQIQKKGAALWKEMREQEKQAYQKIADNANAELGLDSTAATEGSSSSRKASSTKSPAKKNAFQMFMAEKRPDLKAEGLALGQIQKKGAALWKDMGEQEKQAYQKIADNANAELGLDSTTATRGSSSSSKASSSKSPGKKNAFQMFMAEKRPEMKAEGLALGQIQKKGAALWKEMREQEKQAYQKIADNANVELGLLSSKDESSLGKTMAGASKKSPSKRTAYQCFMSTLRPQFVAQGKSFGETTKLIAAQWKKLAQDEKQKYQDLADEYNNNGSTQKNDGSNSSALPQQGQPDGDSSTIGAPKNNDGKVLSVSR